MEKNYYFCPDLKKTGMCGHILAKLSNTTFHENPFSGYGIVSCVKTDERTERILKGAPLGYECAKKRENYFMPNSMYVHKHTYTNILIFIIYFHCPAV